MTRSTKKTGNKTGIIVLLLYIGLIFLLLAACGAGDDISGDSSDITESTENRENSENSTQSEESEISNGTSTSDESQISEESSTYESSAPSESSSEESSAPSESEDESKDPPVKEDYMKGMWVSQFDMQSVYLDGGVQRSKASFTSMVNTIVSNIKKDGFNTVFLQMRPYGDSFYISEYYPVSRFVAGSYGSSISYDPIEIFIDRANAAGLSVHGWINPLRLMTPAEMSSVGSEFLVKQWYTAGGERVVEVNGRLYLNPAYPEARELIADGAAEILRKYNVDGIHIDDYFYPTSALSFDAASYAESGFGSLVAFRENNINLLVKGLYDAVHTTDSDAVFGVSPAGNIATVRVNHYVDVEKWCSEDGYLDYILPQIYFGFLHGSCPFDGMVDAWSAIVTNPKVKYYVGMSGGNAFGAYNGAISTWAGTEAGKYEWINNTDVLKRSFEYIFADDTVDGYVFFCYQYLYSPTNGTPVINLQEEYDNFIGVILS